MAAGTPVSQLEAIVRRITEQETQLAALRSRLDSRLSRLQKRRDALQSELRDVESQIERVESCGPTKMMSEKPAAAPAKAPAEPGPAAAAAEGMSLPELLVEVVREAGGRPVTHADFREAIVSRKFPSESRNLAKMVANRASELVKRGKLRRDKKSGGFLLKSQAAAMPNGASQPAVARKKPGPKPKAAPMGRPPMRGRTGPGGQPPLRVALLNVLRNADRPLPARDLADLVLKSGYKSSSKDFLNVVWVALGQLRDEIERDPSGAGYRLKK